MQFHAFCIYSGLGERDKIKNIIMKERGSYFVALFFIVLCGLMACSKDDDKVLEVTSIKFEKENIVLSDGEKYTIKVLHFPEG